MSKHDWLVLFIRVTGLYLFGTYIGSFVTTASTLLVMAYSKQQGPGVTLYMWQSPIVSAIVLMVGLLLVFKAPLVAAMIEKGDR